MFRLTIHDRIGNELKLGDIVKISNGRHFTFYAEMKYIPEEEVIAPFHTFTFHSFERVDTVPDHAVQSAVETRYRIWVASFPEIDPEEIRAEADRYLIEWRSCEHLLEKKIFRIKPLDP